MRGLTTRTAFAAGAVSVMLILSGCTGGTGDSSGSWESPQLPDELPPVTESTTLPLDAYKLSEGDRTVMQQGNIALLAACAATYGVTVEFSGDYLRPADETRTQWGGRFGAETLDHAALHGYHPAPGGPWAFIGGYYLKDVGNIQVQPTSGGSDAQHLLEQEVIYGTNNSNVQTALANLPDGGCWAFVEDLVKAPLANFVQNESDLYNLALADDRVVAAQAVWSSCMAEEGYTFHAVDEPITSFALTQTSIQEVETAMADVKCTESSGWARIFYAILSAYEQQALDRDPNSFESALTAERKRLDAIAALR